MTIGGSRTTPRRKKKKRVTRGTRTLTFGRGKKEEIDTNVTNESKWKFVGKGRAIGEGW